ncbi:hypothetical protein E0H75_01550 [Kribbella capetownensis]|uniref:Uncharacterized protein n=1 Tax=Kribbella capetownensis TaxID=1572659 RepID=A0A4R0K260_9ACTN|nr:hypothetical protein E0H75_01550 [Kribbella capetownensis]
MVGAEMLNWSDLHPVDARPAASGPAAAALLAATLQPNDAVLLAGPHSLNLIADIAARVASVDVLVRSAPDAEEIAGVIARPLADNKVFCGALDRFTPTYGNSSGYDAVVALDGLDRLVGPDTAKLGWADALAALQARLAPSGRLLLGAENQFGFERLLQPAIAAALPRNEDWARDLTDAAPGGLKPLQTALEDAGLDSSTMYAVFPSLVDAQVALTEVSGPLPAAVAARTMAARYAGPTLMDPYRFVQDTVRAGLTFELAPAWYVVTTADDLPGVLPADAVPGGSGVLLEEYLLAALRVDQAAVRRTVPEYVSWLREQDDATAQLAALDNVILDGMSFRLFAESEPVTAYLPETLEGDYVAPPGEALVVAHLARFARRSLDSGSRQPWPAGGYPDGLTARLAAMAGITVTKWLSSRREMVRPLGSAEQLATVARLSEELASSSARGIIFHGQISGIRQSKPYRVGHAVTGPLRHVLRVQGKVRRLARKVRGR